MQILLVEDQTFAADITKMILTDLHCDVDLSPDSKTAILKANNNHYDLIFMDIELSDLNGYETTKRIRSNESKQGKHVPIVALTAYIDNHDKKRCLNVGMNAILIKPLSKEKAVAMLNTFIPKAKDIKIPITTNDTTDWSLLTGKIIDLRQGAELFNGNIALAKKMIDTFIAALPKELEILKHSYKTEDWATIEKMVHQLRGNVSYCGMPRLQKACARLENHLKAGYKELASLLYKQLLNEIENVKKEHLRTIG
jgi:CheY-like chemotaxis protein